MRRSFSGYVIVGLVLVIILGVGLTATESEAQGPDVVYLPFVSIQRLCTNTPALVRPPNLSVTNTLWPTYEWNWGNNPGATESWFEVALDPAFAQRQIWWRRTGINGTTDQPQYSRPFYNLAPATIYYFRAYIKCGLSLTLYSDVWSFTTGSSGTILPPPELLAPSNGSNVSSTTVTLHWSALSGVDHGYMVYYRPLGGYETEQTVGTTTEDIGPLAAATTYEWWVRGINDYALGSQSAKWRFTTP